MIQLEMGSRRDELAAFLRARRSGLRPEQVGFTESPRRHVSGLRREEVARLAGISPTWYTWIEQGRDINFSPDVLERVGKALRLSAGEMTYVHLLAGDEPARTYDLNPNIPEALRALVESHQAAPAYITTPRFDLLVWNDFVANIFEYGASSDQLSRNILWRLFFDPSRRSLYVDWEQAARVGVATFRYSFSRYRGDAAFERLLGEMMESPDFVRIWEMHEVSSTGMPPFLIRHATRGMCELTTISANLGVAPGCYLVLFSCKQLS